MKIKKIIALALATATVFSMSIPVFADSASNTVVCLGADLSDTEKNTVYGLLSLDDATLADSTVITVTNEEEHQYLDTYLPADVIGSRALSSCIVREASEGDGIHVSTHNISYCTEKMYQNALATAGMKNAEVVVAGPFELSGTAALVGALKAYSEMTGQLIPAEAIETATNEIVTTSTVAENIEDQDKAAELIAAVKEIAATNDLKSDEDIKKAIDDVAGQLGITLTDDDKTLIITYIKQFVSIDIDIDQIKSQAPGIYDELKGNGIDLSQYGISSSEFTGILGKLAELWNSIRGFFQNLFG